MWKQIAGWLAWFYTFGIAENDDLDPDDPDNAADPDDPGNEDDPDPDAAGGDDPDEGGGGDSRQANIKALRKERQTERDARIAAETRLATLEAQNRELAARANGGDRETEPPADEDATQRFVREGSNVLKKNTQKIDHVTFIALDAADQVKFYSKASQNPMIDKYRDRVEAELERMQREEKNRAPRHLILTYLIGKDAENAAIAKAKNPGKRKTQDEQDAADRTREARKPGSPPRSDAKGGERKSDRQKRIDRLTPQNI